MGNRGAWGTAVGVLATVVLAAGCESSGTASPVTSKATTTTTTTPVSLPPGEYQVLLDEADRVIAAVADRFAGTLALTDYTALTKEFRDVLEAQATVLDKQVPPSAVGEQHREVVKGLRVASEYATSVTFSGSPTDSCGLPTRVTPVQLDGLRLSTMETSKLKTRAAALTGKGYKFGSFVALVERPLALPAEQSRRAGNGEMVLRNGPRGRGVLKVINSDESDVAVAVMTGTPPTPQSMVYVRAGATARVTGVGGGYEVFFKTGADWDPAARGFTRDCAFQKFDQPFGANESWEITLKKRVGGNASTSAAPNF
ncbi:hypothetical protein [Actinokineospora sp. NBRC 105648]|uniref:hypothetical protein n=1 Tax=Actinokineospora sp. NBRC 105648 TaxID=3032206 RepID=UPI0024A3F969|nr:hypothetical protein [Actinokineospora sp. NBRC 105648]GLZ42783.1 hypothetical protein Acsp05_64070 [Actinokineospora sp. NBRC 105648]